MEIRSRSLLPDDVHGMPGFFGKMLERLSLRESINPAVRSAFLQAKELEGRVHLVQMDEETSSIRTWRADLESVDESSFLISEPVSGVGGLALQDGQVIEVAILGRAGRQCGMAACFGRERIPSGGQVPLGGYRMAYPPRLEHNERRRAHRVSVGYDLAPLARIFDGRTSGPVEASIMDLSVGGMQLRCDSHPGRFDPGQSVDLEVHLPEPVGRLLIPVRVASIRDDESGQDRLGVAFVQQVHGMAELVRNIEVRRARRRRGGEQEPANMHTAGEPDGT